MGASLSLSKWLPVGMGLGEAALRPRHLSVVRADQKPEFAVPAMVVTANSLGTSVLKARNPEELIFYIDEVLEDKRLPRMMRLISEEFEAGPEAFDAKLPRIQDSIPPDQAERLDAVVLMFEESQKLRAKWLERFGHLLPTATGSEEKAIVDRMYDSHTPPEVILLTLDYFRGEVAILGLQAIAIRKCEVPPWLTEKLVDHAEDGVYASLRLYASIPELQVSTELVPEEDRLQLEEVYARTRKAEVGARILIDMFKESGKEIWFPFAHNQDTGDFPDEE